MSIVKGLAKILCKVGVHRWEVADWSKFITHYKMEQCQRCRVGRVNFWSVMIGYSAAEMIVAKYRAALRERHGDPDEFEAALNRAMAQGFIEPVEAQKANENYRFIWNLDAKTISLLPNVKSENQTLESQVDAIKVHWCRVALGFDKNQAAAQ